MDASILEGLKEQLALSDDLSVSPLAASPKQPAKACVGESPSLGPLLDFPGLDNFGSVPPKYQPMQMHQQLQQQLYQLQQRQQQQHRERKRQLQQRQKQYQLLEQREPRVPEMVDEVQQPLQQQKHEEEAPVETHIQQECANVSPTHSFNLPFQYLIQQLGDKDQQDGSQSTQAQQNRLQRPPTRRLRKRMRGDQEDRSQEWSQERSTESFDSRSCSISPRSPLPDSASSMEIESSTPDSAMETKREREKTPSESESESQFTYAATGSDIFLTQMSCAITEIEGNIIQVPKNIFLFLIP